MIQQIVQKMVNEQIEQEREKSTKSASATQKLNDKGMEEGNKTGNFLVPAMKSPSEPTLYTAAIGRAENDSSSNYRPLVNRFLDEEFDVEMDNVHDHDKLLESKHIDDMITHLRLGQTSSAGDGKKKEERGGERTAAEKAILDAERFKAQIQQPTNKGMFPAIKFNNGKPMAGHDMEILRQMRYLDAEDDEFFHTICHIDPAVKEKIGKGGFVELEKLIQKKTQIEPSEKRMQLVNKDGQSCFVPFEREIKIDGIRKWEQAFRVYTTIYCQANPARSGEILQYVDVIHRAAAIFSWDNVAKYDYVFRQLMAEKPYRSWAKTYTQMWNITLNEPIKRFQENGNNGYSKGQRDNNQRKKDSYCWEIQQEYLSLWKKLQI